MILLFLICTTEYSAFGQKVNNLSSHRNMGSDSYFRIHYDNDYFTTTDENYTQGIQLELALPIFKKNPVNYLFPSLPNSNSIYGLSIEHNGFTPDDIRSKEIQKGDRPFAAAIMLKSFKVTKSEERPLRLASSLSVGVIGPLAFGYEMQKGIHIAIDGAIPGGWRNQIHNDAVINYRLTVERDLYIESRFVSLSSHVTGRLGTYHTNASIGFNANLGFVPQKVNSKFDLYLFAHPQVNFVAYDATLQGGFFQKSSPYQVPSSDIERLVLQMNYGLVLKLSKMYFEYYRTSISKEFETGERTRWGGVRIGFLL